MYLNIEGRTKTRKKKGGSSDAGQNRNLNRRNACPVLRTDPPTPVTHTHIFLIDSCSSERRGKKTLERTANRQEMDGYVLPQTKLPARLP